MASLYMFLSVERYGNACTLAKVMEGFVESRLVSQILDKLDPWQYPREEHSTTDALIYLLQAIHRAMVRGGTAVLVCSMQTSQKVSTSNQ